jgi:hypothetical protein
MSEELEQVKEFLHKWVDSLQEVGTITQNTELENVPDDFIIRKQPSGWELLTVRGKVR